MVHADKRTSTARAGGGGPDLWRGVFMSVVSLEPGASTPRALDIAALPRHDDAAPLAGEAPAADPTARSPLLSVIIPVYNERHTLGAILAAVDRALPGTRKEIIVVDDGSCDGTREWLNACFPDGLRSGSDVSVGRDGNLVFAPPCDKAPITIEPLYHPRNLGKGAALRTGLAAMRGDVVVIQDA